MKKFLVLLFILSMFFAVHVQAASVTLAWDASQGATGYKLFYGTAARNYSTNVDVHNVLQFQLNNLTEGTKYYFAATAYNASMESDYSDEISYTPPVMTPAVANVRLAMVTTTQRAGAFVTWDNNGSAGYKIKYGTVKGVYPTVVDAKLVNPYLIANLPNQTTYYLIVVGYNAAGVETAVSNELTFKTLSALGLRIN
jgi:hypothetical protein